MSDKQNIFNLAYRYTRALSRWIKAGRPVRNEEEIKRIFESFCEPCEAYESESSSCLHCGCRVNLANAAMLNKIAMATEECPLDKWRKGKTGDGTLEMPDSLEISLTNNMGEHNHALFNSGSDIS